MAYSEKSAARLAALHGEIEARKEHEFAAPTYRDAAALAEIRQTVFNQLESEHEHDRDTVEDSIAVLRYLAESYENMGRTACALPLRKKVLELDAELAARFGNSEAFVDENTEEASAVKEGIESDYYCALKARNRYGRDECADLREIAAGCRYIKGTGEKRGFASCRKNSRGVPEHREQRNRRQHRFHDAGVRV